MFGDNIPYVGGVPGSLKYWKDKVGVVSAETSIGSNCMTTPTSVDEKSIHAKVPAALLLPELVLALNPGFPENTQPEPAVALTWNPFGHPGTGAPVLKS